MLFPWKKNRIEKHRDSEALIKELKIEGITENNILQAIKKVPREIFVEQRFIQQAYENIPLPIDCGQTISQPFIVAYMIACLNLKKTDKVLEIGTGTGYQTAILSHLCKEVCTIEIHSKLLNQAKEKISKLNLKNISFKLGNGNEGWNDNVFFDAVIISAASETVPNKLLENLKNNGFLVMPKKELSGNQKLILIKKNKETYLEKGLCSVKFVPLLNKNIE